MHATIVTYAALPEGSIERMRIQHLTGFKSPDRLFWSYVSYSGRRELGWRISSFIMLLSGNNLSEMLANDDGFLNVVLRLGHDDSLKRGLPAFNFDFKNADYHGLNAYLMQIDWCTVW